MASIPTATLVARDMNLGTITVRVKEKGRDGEPVIDGWNEYLRGKDVLLLDDAATTGDSLGVAARALGKRGAHVGRAAVLLDREEGASENLEKMGIKLYSAFRAPDLFSYALRATTMMGERVITDENYARVQEYFVKYRQNPSQA